FSLLARFALKRPKLQICASGGPVAVVGESSNYTLSIIYNSNKIKLTLSIIITNLMPRMAGG
ncbi:hypothetical protein, partial [Sunxiuqinia elliptica]|uniref:hypothetical protein n=1 Tax=Sunxiuqinia elliptica TaxID=655355 RepID=UPI001AAC8342